MSGRDEGSEAWEIWAQTVLRWSTEKRQRARNGKRGCGTLIAQRNCFLAGYAMASMREAGKQFNRETAKARGDGA